tara:strand:- start:118 stop:921 length:804 start_codon:yes stop_codon:yes gene_type:complete
MYFCFLDKEKNIVDEFNFEKLIHEKENILAELLTKELINNLSEEKIEFIQNSVKELSNKNLFQFYKEGQSLYETVKDISYLHAIKTEHGNQTGESIILNSLIAVHDIYSDLLFLLHTLFSDKTFYLSNKEYSRIFSFFINKLEEHLEENQFLLKNKKTIQQLKSHFDKDEDVFLFLEEHNKYTKNSIHSTDVLQLDPELSFLKELFYSEDFDLDTISEFYEEQFEDQVDNVKLKRELEQYAFTMDKKPTDFYFNNNYNIITIFIDNN